jgi:hypothetical protein
MKDVFPDIFDPVRRIDLPEQWIEFGTQSTING